MEEGEKGCNWRAEREQGRGRKRQKQMEDRQKGCRDQVSRGEQFTEWGRTDVREETGTAGEQRGRKVTDKPTEMETPSRAGG